MTGRHWLRRDVLLPIFYLLVLGAILYWLFQMIPEVPKVADSELVRLIRWIIAGVYILLILITVRHVLSTYDLERYDPGNPTSLKRLMRRFRYRLRNRSIPEESLLVDLEQSLLQAHYRLEAENLQIGRIYRRSRPTGLFNRRHHDRVILLQHEPLNVFLVDQILQDSIRYIRSQSDKPSRRNVLILVTRMGDAADVASSAAGIVNFLGKFKGGTLYPMLLATRLQRLFYPADRTLLPRWHRLYQDWITYRLKRLIYRLPQGT